MAENFEEKLNKAQELLDKLNQSDISLAESMKTYKDGIKKLNEASKILENAKLEFEQLSEDEK